jgi:hypothetical protein
MVLVAGTWDTAQMNLQDFTQNCENLALILSVITEAEVLSRPLNEVFDIIDVKIARRTGSNSNITRFAELGVIR